jgi:hypothetical protein
VFLVTYVQKVVQTTEVVPGTSYTDFYVIAHLLPKAHHSSHQNFFADSGRKWLQCTYAIGNHILDTEMAAAMKKGLKYHNVTWVLLLRCFPPKIFCTKTIRDQEILSLYPLDLDCFKVAQGTASKMQKLSEPFSLPVKTLSLVQH